MRLHVLPHFGVYFTTWSLFFLCERFFLPFSKSYLGQFDGWTCFLYQVCLLHQSHGLKEESRDSAFLCKKRRTGTDQDMLINITTQSMIERYTCMSYSFIHPTHYSLLLSTSLTASMTCLNASLGAATTPLFSLSVLPRPKLRGLPYASLTSPPASWTSTTPAA